MEELQCPGEISDAHIRDPIRLVEVWFRFNPRRIKLREIVEVFQRLNPSLFDNPLQNARAN